MPIVITIAGQDKTSLVRAKSLSIRRRSEGQSEASFTLVSTAGYMPEVGAEVIITLDTLRVFGGIIRERGLTRLNSDKCSIKVSCHGFNLIPRRRTANFALSNIKAGQAVSYILQNHLSQEGITTGAIEDGITLQAFNGEYKSLQDLLDDLAKASGFKWYINENKQLFFIKDDPVTDAPFQLQENGSFRQFGEIEITHTLDGYRNRQYVKKGEDMLVSAENPQEIQLRASVEGGTGIYEEVSENNTVELPEQAQAVANDLIARFGQHIPTSIAFSTNTPGFDAGQKLIANLPKLGATGTYLIEEVELSDEGNAIKYTVNARKKDVTKTTKKDAEWPEYFKALVNGAKGKTIEATTIISNVNITNSLYADFGWIANLTVDRLITGDFTAGDEEVNYIDINDQRLRFITARRMYTESMPDPDVQYSDDEGNLYFWKTEEHKQMGTTASEWPVMVHPYEKVVKLSIEFVEIDGEMLPKIQLGAGSDSTGLTDRGKAFIWKTLTGLNLQYHSTQGLMRTIALGEDGITFYSEDGEINASTWKPVNTLIKDVRLFKANGSLQGMRTQYADNSTIDWDFERDVDGRITKIINRNNYNAITVNQNAGTKPW